MSSGYVTSGGTNLYYETSGHGPAVLFIHAGVCDSRMWRDQMDLEGIHAIVFDQRGFGNTEWVPGPYANRLDALTVLDHLGIEEAVVVGCSNGGEAALQTALIAPERVAGLVIVGSAPRGWEPANGWGEEPFEDEIVAAQEAGDVEAVVRLEARLWLAGAGRDLEDLDPSVVELFLEMDRIPQTSEQERNDNVQTLEPPTNEQLGRIRVPTSIIVGRHDLPILHEAADYMAEQLSDRDAVVLEHTAHLPSMEVPDAFNEVLSTFLGSI